MSAHWGEDGAGTNSGAAYVFRTTDGGATYGLVARLTASTLRIPTTSAPPWRSTATRRQ